MKLHTSEDIFPNNKCPQNTKVRQRHFLKTLAPRCSKMLKDAQKGARCSEMVRSVQACSKLLTDVQPAIFGMMFGDAQGY